MQFLTNFIPFSGMIDIPGSNHSKKIIMHQKTYLLGGVETGFEQMNLYKKYRFSRVS